MSWVAAGVTAAGAIYQGVKGAQQKSQAKRLQASTYVPPELLANKQAASIQANASSYPGEEADKAALDRNVANTVGFANKNLKSGSDILNLAGATNATRNNTVMDMSKRFQAFKQQSLNRLMSANAQVGQVQNQNYQQFLNTKQALLSAGDQNIYGGITGLAGSYAVGSGLSKPNPIYKYNRSSSIGFTDPEYNDYESGNQMNA